MWKNFLKFINGNKRLCLLVIPVTHALSSLSQITYYTLEAIDSIPVVAESITTDPLGNLYIIHDGEIKKYSNEGKWLAQYRNSHYGNIAFADASDPLRVLVYYRDFNTVVFLDKFLAELRSPFSLDDLGMPQAHLVCTSSLGGFWIFHAFERKLYLFNQQIDRMAESFVIPLLPGDEALPYFMTEKNREVFLISREAGILRFNQYGSYITSYPIIPVNGCQIIMNNIVFFQTPYLYEYHMATGTIVKISPPFPVDIQQVQKEGNTCYAMKPGKIVIYTLQNIP